MTIKAMRRALDRSELESHSLQYLAADLMAAGYPTAAEDVLGLSKRLEFLVEEIAIDLDEEIERQI